MDWQPISTAPKDGAELLLWTGVKQIVGFYFEDDFGEWVGLYTGRQIFPTHWQPLPPPPGKENE